MSEKAKKEALVKNIKDECTARGISIRQMEEDLKFSPGLISRWVRMSPSVDKTIAVADYLGVSLDALIGRTAATGRKLSVEKICSGTEAGKLLWSPCGVGKLFSYPVWKLEELQSTNWECGYCNFGEGFLLLACALDEENEIENISLYVLPDKDEKPVYQEIDGDELLPLYDMIHEDIIWREDKVRAQKLIDAFMNNDKM